jgi:hypothetical protein
VVSFFEQTYNALGARDEASLSGLAIFRRSIHMAHSFGEQELADYLFDRIIVNCPTCLDNKCLRVACLKVAEELLEDAEISYKLAPVSDGGA